jgi:hypothetical protein
MFYFCQTYVASVLIWMLHMFHTYVAKYVQNVSVVSVFCCSACLHGGKLQVFYLMLHMFHTYVTSICSKCFIDVAFKCFMLHMFHTVWRVNGCKE